MKLDIAGYNFIAKKEGFRSNPYIDSVGVATIGYGTIKYPNGKKVSLKDKPVTQETAFSFLKRDADIFAQSVFKYVGSSVNQNQFNALVSFSYNLGIRSIFLNKVAKNPNSPTVANEFKKWVYGNVNGVNKKLDGLIKRRSEEVEMYFQKKKSQLFPVRRISWSWFNSGRNNNLLFKK